MERPSTMRHRGPFIAVLCLLSAASAVHAQKLKHRMAEQYAAVFDYPRMAEVYEDIIASGKAVPDDYRQLAQAYVRMDQDANAAGTYMKLIALGNPTPADVRAYADLLRATGDYDGALTWYATYARQVPDDPWAKEYAQGKDFFKRLMQDSTGNAVRVLPINSKDADLAPAVMQDLLLFSSARGEGAGGRTKYKWDQEPFLNLYTALLKGDSATDPLVMRRDLNSRFHDGTATFDSTGQRLYFTRDNFNYGRLERSSDGELKLGIYYSDITRGEFGLPEWGEVLPFAHNDPEYDLGQPSLSPDGKRLYFVSDMPGGSGGTDIWYCDDLGGQWGAPQNIGPKINTPGDEMYPFVTADSTLYFSSDGHPGLGGHDIFSVKLTPTGPGHVFNLGYPLNTSSNDRGLILLAGDSTGFFFSDRPGGRGSDDIYGCTVHPPRVHLEGIVVDKLTQAPLDGSTFTVRDAQGDLIDEAEVDYLDGGRFSIDLPYSGHYTVGANRGGYRAGKVDVDVEHDDLAAVTLELEKADYAAEGTVQHGETKAHIAGATVLLCDRNGNTLEETVTDAEGNYAFALQQETEYRLKVLKDGFFKQSARISTKGKGNIIIHTDFILFPLQVDQVVRLDNIYYDVAKWNIRKDAAVELDKLVQTLNDNPSVRIELSAHTDCRGKDGYNLALSEKRAKSAVAYVVKQGIAKDRLIAKGYGESKPVEPCECGTCTEEENQANRRTEFKVLSK